jgi:uncharacterized protein
MGPLVDASFDQLLLRPYKSATTYVNLRRTGEGILHVTDDVDLIAQAAIGQFQGPPELLPAEGVEGFILADTCRWFAFRVVAIDASAEPAEMRAVVVSRGRRRDFFGFNRAKHAVLEAAILATRVDRLAPAAIRGDMARLAVIVEKTAGDQESRAFGMLSDFIDRALES